MVNKAAYEQNEPLQRRHSRLEQRSYSCFKLSPSALAFRWKDAGIVTLVQVRRIRQKLDGSQPSEQVSYFLSNLSATSQKEANELFDAIRHHWRIEAMHYRRDVTLKEDRLPSRSQPMSRLMSSLRSLTLNLLRRTKPKNMAAQIEAFADNFQSLIQFMTQELVL